MKKSFVASVLFVFALAIAAPAFAEVLPQEPAKKETCDKAKKAECAEKKAECTEKKAECAEKAEKKACCSKGDKK